MVSTLVARFAASSGRSRLPQRAGTRPPVLDFAATRSFNRRAQITAVSVCTQLSSLWAALVNEAQPEPKLPIECELTYSDWTCSTKVRPDTRSSMWSARSPAIVPGCAVGLRTGTGAGLADLPGALGPQQGAAAMSNWAWKSLHRRRSRCGYRPLASRAPEPPIPALLLPALPALCTATRRFLRFAATTTPVRSPCCRKTDGHLKVVPNACRTAA
jgi:hypothetical protein